MGAVSLGKSKKKPKKSSTKEKEEKPEEGKTEKAENSPKKEVKTEIKKLTALDILKESPYVNPENILRDDGKKYTLQELFERNLVKPKEEKMEIILTGQYKKAYDLILEADASNLYPILVGPPGVGKTTLCRYYALQRAAITGNSSFEWVTFDESTKPTHLVGSFNPAITLQKGFKFESFNAGPLLKAMLNGGVFLANEVNRATEYTQNSLLEPLEEKTIAVPHIGRVSASPGFFFIGAMNPSELAGTHRLGEALKDRFNLWIELGYPDKKTEKKIIEHNNPYYNIDDSVLDNLYLLIDKTRRHYQVQRPASLRSGIAIARLVGINLRKDKNQKPNDLLKRVAQNT